MCRCARGILRSSAWVAVLSFALFGASISKAGTLTVDFNLNNSTLQIGNLINLPQQMTTVTGSTRVVLTGVDANGMVTDPMATGTVSGLNLTFTLNQGVMVPAMNGMPAIDLTGAANLVGTISITQMGMATGTFDGSALTVPTGSFSTLLATNVDVSGVLAATVRMQAAAMGLTLPIVQMTPISNDMAPFTFTLSSLASGAKITAAVMAVNSGQAVNLTFAGSETARMFAATPPPPPPPMMPEPVESGLLILSVLSLCGVAAVRKQRVA